MRSELDKYGNSKRRAAFETALAKSVLDNSSSEILSIIHQSIVKCIQSHEPLREHMINIQTAIKWDLSEENFIDASMNNQCALNKFIELLEEEPLNIINSLSLQRLFFERHFEPQYATSLHFKPTFTSSLFFLAQSTSQKNPCLFYESLKNTLMPDSQFSNQNRGRIASGSKKKSYDFGINDTQDTPQWALNWHKRAMGPAKEIFKRDAHCELVKFYEQHQIPYIAGPSGTTAYCLIGAILLVPLTHIQLKEYVNLFAAGMIAMGHHSFYDVMLVANNLKLFVSNNATENAASLFSSIDPENIYNTCLTSQFKESEAYDNLLKRYPEYLEQNLDTHSKSLSLASL